MFATFTTSYERLSLPARHLYRRLALLPGADFTVESAAAVARAPQAGVREALGTLADVGLVRRASGGRFCFPDLARAHARELAEGDPLEQREAALHQAVLHYLCWAAFADRAVTGERPRIADHTVLLSGIPDPFVVADEARAWFQAERANLSAVVRAAHDAGFHRELWQLAEALVALYPNHHDLSDWVVVSELGAASARAADEPRAEARLRLSLSHAHLTLNNPYQARTELTRATRIANTLEDPALSASIQAQHTRLSNPHDN